MKSISISDHKEGVGQEHCDANVLFYDQDEGDYGGVGNSLYQKKKKFEFCFVRFVALEGWYGDPRKRFSNL